MEFFAKDFQELTATQVYEILKSRSQIFMLEQNIHCLDMDDVDYQSRHFFLWDKDRVVAYQRAFYLESNIIKIGRVLSLQHKRGLGTQLMKLSLQDIKRNMPCDKICVDAQVQAIGFYEKMGFCVTSEAFMEEGIPHISMERKLQ